MAKEYFATQSDVDAVQFQVTSHDTNLNDPENGLNRKAYENRSSILGIQSVIGGDDTAGLRLRIKNNETKIGDSNSGLTKGLADVISVIGANSSQGLQKRTSDIEEALNTENTGLIDKVSNLETKTNDLAYNSTTKRYSQQASPTETADSDTDLLTKKDGDELYGAESAMVKADAGAYNSGTANDDWNDVCVVGNLKIQARYPVTATDPFVRVLNETGSNVVFMWTDIDNGTITQGSDTLTTGSGLEIDQPTTDVRSVNIGIYTSSGVNTEAYTAQISLRRVSGARMAGSIVGKF